jgi:AbrB family looped-hinge helix DNA binding protein
MGADGPSGCGRLATIGDGILNGMKTTIDRVGRLVVPKELRDRLGISAGSRVEISEDGGGIRVELVAADNLIEVDGYLLIGSDGGASMTDDDVRELRLGNQR